MRKILCLCLVLCIVIIPTISLGEVTNVEDMFEVSNQTALIQDDNHAIISFEVKNITSTYYTELYYVPTLSILRNSKDNVINYLVPYYEYDGVKFELAAKEKKTLTYECKFNSDLPEGEYAISINFYNKTYQLSGYKNIVYLKPIEGNSGLVVETEPAYILCGDKMVDPGMGYTFNGTESLKAVITISSTFNEEHSFVPELSVYKRTKIYNSKAISVNRFTPVRLKAGETKKVEIDIPMFLTPESYLGKIRFLDENQKQISRMYDFRYVISGESANIHTINAETKDGATIVSAEVVGPADGKPLDNAKLVLKVFNSLGILIGEKTEVCNLDAKINKIESSIKPTEKDITVKAVVTVEKNEKVLAKREQTLSLYKADENANQQFSDLVGTKYYDAVTFLNGLGILNGYPDGTFLPENQITRAEFTVIAAKLSELKIDSNSISPFSDVVNNHWAKTYINSCAKAGYLSGYPDGTFKPSNQVKYSESLTILLNILGYKVEVANSSFPWPLNYVSKSEEIGLHKNLGIEDFSMEATRGNVALLVYNTYLQK